MSMAPHATALHHIVDVEDMDLDSSSGTDSDEVEQQAQRSFGWRSVVVCTGLALLALACWLGFAPHGSGHRSTSSHLAESQIATQFNGLRQEAPRHTRTDLVTHAPSLASEYVTVAATTTPLLEGSATLSEDLHDGNVCKND